jgi:ACS family tartrate transporter-like MFS transporter
MVTWGVLSTAMMWTQGTTSFYALRFLLGVAEAGCFPGMAYYLSQWLTPRQRTTALASLATMAMASGLVGAPVAAALLSMHDVWGLAGWQWLFLVEGLPAIVIGLCIYILLPDGPNDAKWLTDSERRFLLERGTAEESHRPSLVAIRSVVCDRRYWFWGLAFFCVAGAGSALRLFQPTILRAVTGVGDVVAALITAVPSLVGICAIVYVGRRSTRYDERRWHAAVPMLVGAIGLALVGSTYGIVGALVVASIASAGVASQPPLFASVSAASTGTNSAVAIAFVNSVGGLGAFLGPYLVGYALDRTGSLALVCALAGAVMAIGGLIMIVGGERAPVAAKLTDRVATA